MKKNIIISLILLGILIVLVLSGTINSFDNLVYNFIISFKSNGLTSFMKIITLFASVKVMVGLIIISLFTLLLKRKESIYLTITVIICALINTLLKYLFRRNRPIIINLILEKGYSFPSGHTMVSMAFYGSLILFILHSNLSNKYKYILSILLGFLIFLISISRVYLGVHYASDIIGGWLIGFILLNIENYYLKKRGL